MTMLSLPLLSPRGRPMAFACMAVIRLWVRRSATRRSLRDLPVHLLADIGLSERQRRRECAKWFWQA